MTADPDPAPRRRVRARRARTSPVVVAVVGDELRDRLDATLEPSDLDVSVVVAGPGVVEEARDAEADLIVVRRDEVRPETLERADLDDAGAPDVVVVQERRDEVDRARLFAAGVSDVLESDALEDVLTDSVAALADAIAEGPHMDPDAPRLDDFRSRSPSMDRLRRLALRVVDTDSSLLITGETGVGKERLARAIHREGARGDGPFVTANCGAIPESLLESELFGHTAGAFTGAARERMGRFEQASGGTIFLDEIGEMPVHLQVSLLSVLQSHSVQPVGSETRVPIDVRVMAATNRDLMDEIVAERFREDLYYRINVVELEVPPLRERVEDIPDMVGSVIHGFRRSLGRERVNGLTERAMEALLTWPWPGNVRELVNAVEHAMVLCDGTTFDVDHLPTRVATHATDAIRSPGEGKSAVYLPGDWKDLPLAEARQQVVERFERRYLDELLQRTRGRVGVAAQRAGLGARSLYDKLRRHGLRKEDYR